MKECSGIPNVMCQKCWRVIEHKCGCLHVRMCRCAKPEPFPTELPKEADNHERP